MVPESNPLDNPFPDTHLLAHFPPDTITYDEPTIPPYQTIIPRIEVNILNIYCIHNRQTHITSLAQNTPFEHIPNNLHISHTRLWTIPSTPHAPMLMPIKRGPPPYTILNHHNSNYRHIYLTTISTSHLNFQLSTATTQMVSSNHPRNNQTAPGEGNKQDTIFITLIKI